MKRTTLLAIGTLTLCACGGADEGPAGDSADRPAPQARTEARADAPLTYRITETRQVDMGNYCELIGEIENRGDAPIYAARIRFESVHNEVQGKVLKTNYDEDQTVYGPTSFAETNPDPIMPGETRAVTGRLQWQCDAYASLAVDSVSGRTANEDGTAGSQRLTADMLIVESAAIPVTQ